MKQCPATIGDADVVAWAHVTPEVRPTHRTVHRFHGAVLGAVPSLAICRYGDAAGFYLFYCNAQWEPIADTWHQSLVDAKAQAEFEYQGIQDHWQTMG